jgi:hypothetical protein
MEGWKSFRREFRPWKTGTVVLIWNKNRHWLCKWLSGAARKITKMFTYEVLMVCKLEHNLNPFYVALHTIQREAFLCAIVLNHFCFWWWWW